MSQPLVFGAPRRGKAPGHLADLDAAGLRAAVGEIGLPAYRADQLARQYYGRFERDPAAMTELPAVVRADVRQRLFPTLLAEVRSVQTDAGTTRKTLWRLHDGTLVESVLMKYPDRVTLCVSSQAGCGMACPFCATGQGGLQRNLSTAEIVEQVVAAAAMAARGDLGAPARLSNVVFMGMGEPLANPARVHAALRRLIDPVPNGAFTRNWVIVPAAADDYAARTGRRYSIEYAMIRDVNDQPRRADLLGKLLAPRLAHLNLIPLNPTPGSQWDASPKPVEAEFARRVRAHGVAVTVRDTRGRDIDGACGQLAASGR